MRTTLTKQNNKYQVVAHDHHGKEGNLGILLRFFKSLVEEGRDRFALAGRKGGVKIVLTLTLGKRRHEKKHRRRCGPKLDSLALKHVFHVLNRLLRRCPSHLPRKGNNTQSMRMGRDAHQRGLAARTRSGQHQQWVQRP